MTRTFRVPGVVVIPIGLFDEPYEWKPHYEQFRHRRLCFVEDIHGVQESKRYTWSADPNEFDGVKESLEKKS